MPPNLKFADDTFDIVYAPYLISVVPDPVAVAREMHRVCRPGGRIVILNHFRSTSRVGAWLERIISPFTVHIGFKSDLDLPAFLAQADCKPISIEKVNVPRIWSLVTCIKTSVQTREACSALATGLSAADLTTAYAPNGCSIDGLCGVNSSAPVSVMCMSSSSRTPNSPSM